MCDDKESVMNKTIRTAAVAVVAAALGALVGMPAIAGAELGHKPPAPTAPSGEPVQAYVRLDPNGSINLGQAIYVVPVGKRLEVQHVSFIDEFATVGIQSVTFSVVKDDVTRPVFLPTRPQGATSDVASEVVTAYADPGTEVFVSVTMNEPYGDNEAAMAMWATFSGLLYDT